MRTPVLIVAAFLLGSPAIRAAGLLEIPITVAEPAGIDRISEPVSGGIPLPKGIFRPGGVELALCDANTVIPVQVSELVVGPEGWVRWVLLDFQLDLTANQIRTFTLKEGLPKHPADKLQTSRRKDKILIDTGPMNLSVDVAGPFGLLNRVRIAGTDKIKSGRIAYTNALTGRRYLAAAPETVKVHYEGPLRVTVELRGPFEDSQTTGMHYCTYLTAWAGRTDLLVRHSIINSHPNRRHHVKISGSTLALDLAAQTDVIVSTDRPIRTSEEEISLHQGLQERRNMGVDSCRLIVGEQNIWTGRNAGGWLSAGGVWAADRLFSVDPPRSLAITGDGRLRLDAAPALFEGQRKDSSVQGRPYAYQDQHRWLYDCSQLSSEYRIDFDAPDDPNQLGTRAKAAAARVWAFAPGSWYSRCAVLGVGRFGTLSDERTCHEKWNWSTQTEPDMPTGPTRFVGFEDNHYESESDSPEALLLMLLRTHKRGFFDEAEAWVRYHTDLQTWRTEGWAWKDGGIWFPQGGPPGNRPVREKAAVQYEHWNKGTDADRTLWRLSMAKECYCHFYGAGLVDWFCLTGDREALAAAIDSCETKWDEYTHFRRFTPGSSPLASTRGFGRGFYVAVRAWMVQPDNKMLTDLVELCRDTLVKLPPEYMDERGVYAPVMHKRPDRYLTDGIKAYMAENGIEVDEKGLFTDAEGNQWHWRDIGGTWMISYISAAANMLAEQTGDEDLIDYVIASGQFTAKYMQSPIAHQTWYYTALDIPNKGDIWDQWKYDGLKRNELGEGPKHSGWYTRFFPDCCAHAYSWTGNEHLLRKAKRFWSFGNRRLYQSTHLTDRHHFATHRPPKDDTVLSTVRLFYESAHPRADSTPPAAITDLSVSPLQDGRVEIRFTAPSDASGKVSRYQVKAAGLPILPYEKWRYAEHAGKYRNWWRAANCTGEPKPAAPGQKEKFTVSEVPKGAVWFAIRSFDESQNRSPISNVVKAK